MKRSDLDLEVSTQNDLAAPRRPSGRQVRLALRLREFDLPPIGDGVVIGKRAPIGPVGLFEAIDRMLPGAYELVPVEGHAIAEAVIIHKRRFRLVERERLASILCSHAEPLMTETMVVRVEVDSEVTVNLEIET